MALAHVLGGLADTGAVIGFGSSLSSVAVGGATIDLSGAVGLAADMSFSMPRAGTIVQLAAFYSNVIAVTIPALSTASVVVQLYRSAIPNNIFSAVPGAVVVLPLPAALVLGTTANGIAAFSTSVLAQDRLLLVAVVTVAGVDVVTNVTGYVSAGLSIV